MSILIFFISLGILILVHELGHFWVARKSGVIVEEFGLGFPPRIFSRKKGDTLYSINLIPLGGFVKLAGEEDPENPKGFLAQPPLKKIAITLAGVVANFILIFV